MSSKYTYNITSDFPNQKVDVGKLKVEIQDSDIITALDYINSSQTECDIWFKAELSVVDSTATLPAIIAAHDGERLPDTEAPVMEDGRPIVRADTRPIGAATFFTMASDSTAIGDGLEMRWDFSNDDNIYTGPEVPSGYKAKQLLGSYVCPVYLKDGTMYFFDAPWGQYINMDIVIPAGNYYPNPAGSIPASALGLPGDEMYSYASQNTPYQKYVNKHFMCGDCPMGDELNAEGAAVDPVPIGWFVRGLIITPDSDNISKGYGALEMYRCHTMLLPGMTLDHLDH